MLLSPLHVLRPFRIWPICHIFLTARPRLTGSSTYPTANPASVCRRNGYLLQTMQCHSNPVRLWLAHIICHPLCSRHCCSNVEPRPAFHCTPITLAVGCSPENWHWRGNCIACTLARSCFCKASSNQLLAHKLMSAYHEMPRTLRVCCKATICS